MSREHRLDSGKAKIAYLEALDEDGSDRSLRSSRKGALHVKSFPGALGVYVGSSHTTSTDGTATALASVPNGADTAIVQVTANSIYYDMDNSLTPAADQGREASIRDDIYLYTREEIDGFRAVRQSATNFTLKVFWYGAV